MSNSKIQRSPFAFAAFLALSASAQAQTTTSPEASAAEVPTLPTVTVSASADASAQGLPGAYAGGQVARGGRLGLLGNVNVLDMPFNSTNYTQALIQDQQSHSVGDVLMNDPSVRVARGFGNYQELYMIRGFAVNSDDLAYNGLYGLLPRQYVATELLERVEAFRGANTFINGAAPGGGGVGGAINLLPKRAGNEDLTQLSLGAETGGQAYVAADIGRHFGPENRAGIRINAARRDGDTSVDREKRELSVLSVGMDYKGRTFRVSADLGFQDHRLTAARPSVTAAPGVDLPAAPDASSNYAQPWTHSNERDTFGTLRGEYDVAKNVVAWAAVGARSAKESNVLAAPKVLNDSGDADVYRFDNEREDQVATGEIGIRAKVEGGSVSHSLSLTASDFHSESRNAYAMSDFVGTFSTNLYRPVDVAAPVANFFVGGDLADPRLTHKAILSSYGMADTMAFANDTVLLTVGVRHQTIKDFSYAYGTAAPLDGSYEASANTPMAGLVYKPMKNLSLYANYIEGLQQGAVAAGVGVTNVGETFSPYKSKQKEIGVKYDLGTVGFGAALFTTKQPSSYIESNVFGVFGEQRNRGLELTVYGAPMRGVRVLGGLTLLDAEQKSTLGGVNNGKDALGVPETQFNLGGEWDVAALRGLSLNSRIVYTSKQYADSANLQELPSWTRLDLGARYSTSIANRNVTFRARVDNVTDRNYWASTGGSAGAGYLVQAAPRTVALTATVDF